MYRDYWNLFWNTGMPQAWLMSREREGRMDAPPKLESGEGLSAPLADYRFRMVDGIPGDPRGII